MHTLYSVLFNKLLFTINACFPKFAHVIIIYFNYDRKQLLYEI